MREIRVAAAVMRILSTATAYRPAAVVVWVRE